MGSVNQLIFGSGIDTIDFGNGDDVIGFGWGNDKISFWEGDDTIGFYRGDADINFGAATEANIGYTDSTAELAVSSLNDLILISEDGDVIIQLGN